VRTVRRQLRGEEPLELAEVDGAVRHIGPQLLFEELGENGDPSSCAHRLRRPEVRAAFRDFVVKRARARTKHFGQGVQYASLGSGELLFDMELIERIRALGLFVKQICLIDREYRNPKAEIRQCLREFADFQRACAELDRMEAAEVIVFPTLEAYYAASRSGGKANGCQIFVQCDVHWKGAAGDCQKLALRALAPNGMLVRLGEDAQEEGTPLGGDEFAGDQLWEQREPPSTKPFSVAAWTLSASEGSGLPSLDPMGGHLIDACNSTIEEALALTPRPVTSVARQREKELRAKAEEEALAEAHPEVEAKDEPMRLTKRGIELMKARERGAAAARAECEREFRTLVTQKQAEVREEERAAGRELTVWRVLRKPSVIVRAEPRRTAKAVGVLYAGECIKSADDEQRGAWLRIVVGPDRTAISPHAAEFPSEAWVLSDSPEEGTVPMLRKVS